MGRHERTARALAAMKRRGLALTGLAMIVAGGIWAAVALASTRVEISKPSGKSEEIEISEDDYDKSNVSYQEGDDYEKRSGRSLASVLKAIGVGDRAWTSITISGLTVQNGSFRAKKPPIFFVRDNDVFFYKPQIGSNSYETRSSSGGDLDMSYRVPLVVESSDDTPKAGQTVTYEVTVPGGGPQSEYEFTWTPSSGTGGTGSTFEYTYPETSGEVTINVTAKRGSDSQTVGTATTAATVKAPPQENNNFGGSGTSYGYTPPSDYDYGYDPNFPNSGSSPDFPETPAQKTDPDEAPPLDPTGISVSGELLSATAPLPPSSGDAGATPEDVADPEAAIEEAEQISGPGALIAAGLVVGLLGLGAGREMETVRPRRLRRPDLSGLRRLSPPWK